MINQSLLYTAYQLGKCSEALKLGDMRTYLEEILSDDSIIREIEQAVAPIDQFKTKTFSNILDFRFYRILTYCLIRVQKPETVIETGVLHGLTSKFYVSALRKNGRGHLFSVDLPSYFESGPSNKDGYFATLPPKKQPGWILNEQDRKQFTLKLGPTSDVLPTLFKETGLVDFFCHDSDHTYENMWFELNLAWEYLKVGGIILCDNIDANSSFIDFCRYKNISPIMFSAPDNNLTENIRFGLIRK